jgi:polar amino acid transport system substrate-binding protein
MKKIFFVVFFSFLSCSAQAEINDLHIGISTGYPPFYFFTENQQPTGIIIDIIDQVATSMNISVSYDSYPWKRMLAYGEEGKVDAVMPLFKTAEREQYLLFPVVELIDEDNSFFTASFNPIEYTGNLADVVNRKIGVMDGFSYGVDFDHTKFAAKTIAKSSEQLINLVQNGRVELGIGNSKVVTYSARQMGVVDKIRFLSPPVTVSPLFIGFSKKCVERDFVDRFSRHLQEFKKTPAYTHILEAYIH